MGKKKLPSKKADADRRLRQANHAARIIRVLQLIQGGGRRNVSEIAKEIECSERTVHRDLNVLELLGVPYYFDQNVAGYVIRPGWQFPVLPMTEDEAIGQAVVGAMSRVPGLDVASGSTPVTRKIAAKANSETQAILRDAEELITVFDLKLADHSQHREMIQTIQRALLSRRQLTGQYASPYQDKSIKLTLHPVRLCLIRQAWYLIARPAKEEALRTFRVTRFKSLRATDSLADVPAQFDLQAFFGNAWAAFRGQPTYDVAIEFTKEAASIVTETNWHATQRVRRHADGRATLSFKVDGLDEIVWWVLGWTGRARVVKPTELRQMVVEKLAVGLKLNESE